MIILLIISMIICIGYLGVTYLIHGVTPSISMSYYKWKDLDKFYGILFTLFCWGVGFTIIPVWLELTPTTWQFTAFLSAAGLLFVGASPSFKDYSLERDVHTIGAGICFVSSLIWSAIVGSPIILTIAVLLIAGAIITRIKNLTYWLEIIAFVNMYIQLMLLI